MQLNGNVHIRVTPAQLRLALDRAEVLRALLPGESSVIRTGAGCFDFTVTKTIGFLEMRQTGTITLAETGPDALCLTMQAAHRIGGTVGVQVQIGLSARPQGTAARYDGTIHATGLAQRMLRDRGAMLQPYLAQAFQKVKAQIESVPSQQG